MLRKTLLDTVAPPKASTMSSTLKNLKLEGKENTHSAENMETEVDAEENHMRKKAPRKTERDDAEENLTQKAMETETEDDAEEDPTKKEIKTEDDVEENRKKTADLQDIAQCVTRDLWSDDPAVVRKALGNMAKLVEGSDENVKTIRENVKTIRSLAGHMMVVAALKKHIQVQAIIGDAIYSLYAIAFKMGDDVLEDAALLGALRSAGAIDVVLQAIETDRTNVDTVEFGFQLLIILIDDSYASALLFNNSTALKDIYAENRGFGLIALVMKNFPLGSTCGQPDCDNDRCKKNQVHNWALRLLKCLAKHRDFRVNILTTGCAAQIVSLLEKVSTPWPVKSPMEWECLAILKLVSTFESICSERCGME